MPQQVRGAINIQRSMRAVSTSSRALVSLLVTEDQIVREKKLLLIESMAMGGCSAHLNLKKAGAAAPPEVGGSIWAAS
jgi:hypothetical protein